ncbi:MAG: stage III sporulation protein AA, partial [Thermacetogeniaceae bacterium]
MSDSTTETMKVGIWQVLPMVAPSLRAILERIPMPAVENIEEIRIRRGRPLAVRCQHEEWFLSKKGELLSTPESAYSVTSDDLVKTLQLVCQGSLYAYEEELRQGFITLPGGHRVGIAGKAILDGGILKTLCEISSLNIRIARAVPGAAQKLLPFILDFREKRPYHTLIVSPPGAGKTTILRDLVRSLSYGLPSLNLPGLSVGVVDERSELAACFQGIPQHDLGPRVDVLDCCPKALGMIMLLR